MAGAATPAFRFEVRAGETSYLGELFMPRSCTLLTAFEVRDQFARDIGLAAAKNPAVTWHPPVRRLLAGAEPAQPSTAGLPPVPPAATAPSASPAVAARPAGVAPATELWAGSMVCGPRSDGRNPGPYDVKFSMEVHGHNVTVFRNTATASEILTGRSDDRQLELRGKGFRLNEPSRNWEYAFSGKLPAGATSYTASGSMLSNGKPIRACELRMARG